MEHIDISLVDWSRAQFALTAMYHWLFVPLTLGLGVIISVMETLYYRTNDPHWKRITQFWMKLFGINFAIGVATGIILEFEFGTNWSNYSWFVGDIFGAPLALEGILAFFMESTFIAVMFFGWDKVGKGFHLASTWLTVIGATISALWILVANAWMQFPDGMHFNPDTVRNEMADFWAVLGSPVAINKFFHTVTSSWIVGSAFTIGVSSWFLLKNRETKLANRSIRIAAVFGLFGALLAAFTGDSSATLVAERQPMKLAAMEGLYQGTSNADLVAFGILNPQKKDYRDPHAPFLFQFRVPGMLSLMANRKANTFVPGVTALMQGGFVPQWQGAPTDTALSVAQKMASGQKAIAALNGYRAAKAKGDRLQARKDSLTLVANYHHFGYGFLKTPEEVIPNVPLTFYTFHLMVLLGLFFIGYFALSWVLSHTHRFHKYRIMLWLGVACIPMAWIASECGWIVAEVGRQPWVIQDIMPTAAAVSRLSPTTVQTTFILFAVLFTLLLAAEIGILLRQIRKGPDTIE